MICLSNCRLRILLLVLGAQSAWAGPLLESDAAAGVGVLGVAYTATGARLGDAHLVPMATARGVFRGFVVDGGLFTASPFLSGRTSFAVNGTLRVGWSGARWAILAGVSLQYAPDARPTVRLLPSVRGQVSFGKVGLSLGVLDHFGTVPAHLSVDLGPWDRVRFSLGWVAPLGLIGSADLSIARGFGLRLTAFAFRIANTESAMVVLSGTFGGVK